MSGLRLAVVVLAAAAVAVVPSAATGHAGPVLRGFGTAVIDGTPAPGEWDAAARHDFTVNRAPAEGGGTVPATLYVMNDAANMYVALRVSNASVGYSVLRLFFDNDHSGGAGQALGDDFIQLGSTAFRDFFLHEPSPGNRTWSLDATYGGTSDGAGLASNHPDFSFYELWHPLDSADNAHDFSLSVGNRIGFDLQFLHCVPYYPCGQSVEIQAGDIIRASGSRIPPDTELTAGPAEGSMTADTALVFQFTGSDDVLQPSQLTFECKTDEEGWEACTSQPEVYVDDGRHTFSVRAVDDMLNVDPTPAQRTWTTDASGPSKPIVRGPRSVRKGKRVVLRFSATDALAGGVRYKCAVDSRRLRNCPAVLRLKLRPGRHVVRVRAVDRLGNQGEVASFRIRVKRARR
jgi:hypothetical protein